MIMQMNIDGKYQSDLMICTCQTSDLDDMIVRNVVQQYSKQTW